MSCFSKVTSTTSKVIRKLEPNEVVMLLSVPCKDSDIDVMRVSGHLETEGSNDAKNQVRVGSRLFFGGLRKL